MRESINIGMITADRGGYQATLTLLVDADSEDEAVDRFIQVISNPVKFDPTQIQVKRIAKRDEC